MRIIASCLFLVLTACQSIPYQLNDEVPQDLSRYFSEPDSMDGGGTLSFKPANAEKSVRTSMDYNISGKDAFRCELSDPMGRVIAAFAVENEQFSYEGKLALKGHTVKVDAENFLLVDDRNTGLKLLELAALLDYKLPLSWLTFPRYLNRDGPSTNLLLRPEGRRIELHFKGDGKSTQKELWEASIIQSFAFGLFEHRLEFKMNLKEQYLTFEREDHFKLTWRRM